MDKIEMGKYYILKNKKAVPVDDIIEWGRMFHKQDRIVAKDTVNGVDISTVFLGFNYQYREGEPLIFETMIFGGKLDQEMDRYSTWEEAEAGHKIMIEKVKQEGNNG